MLVILYTEYKQDKLKKTKQDNHWENLKRTLKAYHIYEMLVSSLQLSPCYDLFTLFQVRHGTYFLEKPHSFLKKAKAPL